MAVWRNTCISFSPLLSTLSESLCVACCRSGFSFFCTTWCGKKFATCIFALQCEMRCRSWLDDNNSSICMKWGTKAARSYTIFSLNITDLCALSLPTVGCRMRMAGYTALNWKSVPYDRCGQTGWRADKRLLMKDGDAVTTCLPARRA